MQNNIVAIKIIKNVFTIISPFLPMSATAKQNNHGNYSKTMLKSQENDKEKRTSNELQCVH